MAWLNYHHLLYFWTVARVGTIAAASKELHLAQPTISTQVKLLEESLGQKLFERRGRRLALTDTGRSVYRYADEIFRLGKELQQSVARGEQGQRMHLTVGIADVVPKLVVEKLLRPALEVSETLRLEVREGALHELLSSLALHELDVVLADQPTPPNVHVKAFNHRLGISGVTFFGTPALAATLKRGFPKSLHLAPMLAPRRGTALRGQLEAFFAERGLSLDIVGEFDDSALLKVFGARGRGVFLAPTVIEAEVVRQFDVQVVGRTDEIEEAFYAISVERRLRHPAVVALAEAARSDLFKD